MSKNKSKKRALKKQLAIANRKIEEFSMDSSTSFTSPSGGWDNPFNDFGPNSDPTFNTTWMPPYEFSFQELINMYHNALMYRITTLHAEDGTRNGFELASKDSNDLARDIQQQMREEYNWLAIGAKLIAMRHQFGGGVIYVDADDGRDPEEPLNENRVKKIWSFQPVENWFAFPSTSRPIFQDEKPGQPLHYRITIQAFAGSQSFLCHESRLIRFPSFESDDVISQSERVRRRTWPISTTQRVYDAIKRYGIGMQTESQLLQGFVEDVFKVQNLKTYKNLADLKAYVQEQRLIRNSLKATVMGSEDALEKLATPTTGLSEITMDHRRDIGMVSGIPVPILFSEESGSLGGSTLSESREVWHDAIRPRQKNQYTPMYWKMMWFKSLEMGWDISDIEIIWNPLETMSPIEQAELELKTAEKDKIYVESLGASEAYILDKRWGSGEFDSGTPDFDKEEFEKELEEMEKAELEESTRQLEPLQNRKDTKDKIEKSSNDEAEQPHVTILNIPQSGVSDESLDVIKEEIKNIPKQNVREIVEKGITDIKEEIKKDKTEKDKTEKESFTLNFDDKDT